ncbi:E3 ubiquitin-protein like [Actinidia chinensis var. chinensis]|uniref:E3 ubiquitin-protein like n=1 Tax=Actinidia chinensis var. chinensis TaxID=1590841 RepID=A0A2R6R8E2_ACTCC|nr:E3 ubiquitin-protein like [Actinidia chinensis var. chinensis]
MEEPDRTSTEHASSSSYSTNREFLVEATTSYSSSSQVREEEAEAEDRDPSSEFFQQQTGIAYHVHYATAEDEEASRMIRDDTWSCIIVVLTFWFFGDVLTTWSQNHSIPLSAGLYKEWIYVLNEGSQVNISYSVNSPSSSSLIIIIAQGSEGFAQWLEDPSYPNTTLSWNIIHGSGTIHQDIYLASSYYVAVGNLNSEEVEVQLNLSMKAFLYNTTKAYYNCALAQGACSLKMFFSDANAAVLTSPGPEQDSSNDMWYVKLSYGPRWITYLLGIGIMSVLMLLAFHFLNNFQCSREEGTRYQLGETRSERAPLLSQKDDDLSSWGSSYDSVSQDEEDLEDGMPVTSLEGKPLKDGEYNNNIRRLCAICFDAPRDCFFLPCGHCVACFACGTRIAELAGTCPICRRNMKKVRRIFSV